MFRWHNNDSNATVETGEVVIIPHGYDTMQRCGMPRAHYGLFFAFYPQKNRLNRWDTTKKSTLCATIRYPFWRWQRRYPYWGLSVAEKDPCI